MCIIGDMNADIKDSKSKFGNHFREFCNNSNLILSSDALMPSDTFTYISDAWHTTLWLAHCMSTADTHALFGSMSVLYGTTVSDHISVIMSIKIDALPVLNKNININNAEKIDWSSLTEEEILGYYVRTDQSLSNIHIPRDAVRCNDVKCSSFEHVNALCV